MLLLEKEQLPAWLNKLIQAYQVFAPVNEEGCVLFRQIEAGEQCTLDYTNTKVPPKEVLFPRAENLFCYRLEKDSVELKEEIDGQRKVVFGIRPCDAKSLSLLDNVFQNEKFQDPYYLARRKNTVLVGLGCNQPLATCFCTSLGSGPFAAEGLDLLLIDLGERYAVEVLTARGEELLSGMELPAAGREALEAVQKVKEEAVPTARVNIEGLKAKLDVLFDHPLWDTLHEKCLGCAACTYTCPTCHCFDISDEALGNEGCRVRSWDACMFGLFTLHGSGHNPRPTSKERFRQRVMHKFKYFVDNFNATACVGCGRCILNCPVNLDIREVIAEIQGTEVRSDKQ